MLIYYAERKPIKEMTTVAIMASKKKFSAAAIRSETSSVTTDDHKTNITNVTQEYLIFY